MFSQPREGAKIMADKQASNNESAVGLATRPVTRPEAGVPEAPLAAKARKTLAGGVTSSWQISRPQPVWLSHASGSKLYDVDGNEYVDMHGGYGVSLAGHGHPAIVAAVQNQV